MKCQKDAHSSDKIGMAKKVHFIRSWVAKFGSCLDPELLVWEAGQLLLNSQSNSMMSNF